MSADEAVSIESLAAGGAGVAHLEDGMIAFVPRAAPGDRVRLTEIRRHRRHATARLGELIEPGPARTQPPCPHFTTDRCGGCQWQHVAADVQSAAKRRIVGDALRRLGGLDLPDPELVPSPRAFGYRTAVTLTVRWTGQRAPVVGFHDEVNPDRVFMLERCPIARDELNAMWSAVRGRADALPRGDDVRLKLRVEPDGTLHALVSGGDRVWTDGEPLAEAARAAGLPATVWWQPARGAVRRVAGPQADPAGVAFGQVNPGVAAMLQAGVIESVRAYGRTGVRPSTPSAPMRVLDLYAGAGETALPLAAAGHEVVLVELDGRAVRRAEERAQAAGSTLRCLVGRVEDHLSQLLPADVVIVNPPRAGLSDAVSATLGACFTSSPPHLLTPSPRLVYVSCDPATLARDLKRMGSTAADVRLARAYDMFPQTSHVETLVVVERP